MIECLPQPREGCLIKSKLEELNLKGGVGGKLYSTRLGFAHVPPL